MCGLDVGAKLPREQQLRRGILPFGDFALRVVFFVIGRRPAHLLSDGHLTEKPRPAEGRSGPSLAPLGMGARGAHPNAEQRKWMPTAASLIKSADRSSGLAAAGLLLVLTL